jgi:hypothetical protein
MDYSHALGSAWSFALGAGAQNHFGRAPRAAMIGH